MKNIAIHVRNEKLAQQNQDLEMTGDPLRLDPKEEDALYLKNIKDDIILIQFKLIRNATMKTVNTISFLNVPMSKFHDVNLQTIAEIVSKYNRTGGGRAANSSKVVNGVAQRKSSANRETNAFLPMNKSILSRVIFPSL